MNHHDLTPRKKAILDNSLKISENSSFWDKKNKYFRTEHYRYLNFLAQDGLKVLDLGCGKGDLLASLKPSYGIGVDFNPRFIKEAVEKYPNLMFVVGDVEDPKVIESLKGPFDIIILSDIIGELDDIQSFLGLLHQHCTSETRIIVTYYNPIWGPFLELAEILHLKRPQVEQNWLSTNDIRNIVELAGLEVIKRDWRQIIPYRLLGVGSFFNRYIATLPLIRLICLRNYVISRPPQTGKGKTASTTILIPCRNERGNIENALKRIPRFCDDMEIIYVEGHSSDGTMDEIQRIISMYPSYDIKGFSQPAIGKADAVRAGFKVARGDILMILDADLTMPPEDLPKFYEALISGKGEFINGSRLTYPMEKDAMRFLNQLANRLFSLVFTYLLNQRFTDTLCGTKALYRNHYEKIVTNRSYFGDFDPFGDFDLI
ncbi:MAG: glycosyltransferase, partial [Methanoregula sp.]|nr:glycosyltransferase [Methanoregula sp.]